MLVDVVGYIVCVSLEVAGNGRKLSGCGQHTQVSVDSFSMSCRRHFSACEDGLLEMLTTSRNAWSSADIVEMVSSYVSELEKVWRQDTLLVLTLRAR